MLLEYYSATELLGWAECDSNEWLSHRGTVGKVVTGEISVLDDDMRPVPITYPKVADAAVFGVPNPDLGQKGKAVG